MCFFFLFFVFVENLSGRFGVVIFHSLLLFFSSVDFIRRVISRTKITGLKCRTSKIDLKLASCLVKLRGEILIESWHSNRKPSRISILFWEIYSPEVSAHKLEQTEWFGWHKMGCIRMTGLHCTTISFGTFVLKFCIGWNCVKQDWQAKF